MDAVLFPRCVKDPTVMAQEGWHYALEKPEDPLTYKGVVFNEMKGVYSSPDSVYNRDIQRALFPDNTYGVDSGGDPAAIPALTFEQFQRFHADNYHPSNARIFFYGDDPEAERLELVAEYLAGFEANPAAREASAVGWQSFQPKPWAISTSYPCDQQTVDAGEAKLFASVNWVLHEGPLDPGDDLPLDVLDHLLCGTSASALRKALSDSKLGASFVGGGMDNTLQQATFSAGLKGIANAEDAAKVEAVVLACLEDAALNGFPEDAVKASLNTLEFRLREFNTGGYPRGLSLMLGCMGSWIYDDDALLPLRFEEPLAKLKRQLAAGEPVFQDLLRKYLLSNPHRCTATMLPDAGMEAALQEQEAAVLAAAKAGMSEQQVLDVIAADAHLTALQGADDSEEDKAKIPRLTLSDLKREAAEIDIAVHQGVGAAAATVLTHALETSGIVYVDLALDLSALDYEADAALLPLLSRMLVESGTSQLDRVQMSRRVGALTGGVGASVMMLPRKRGEDRHTVTGLDDVTAHLVMHGKSTLEHAPELFEIFHDMLTDAQVRARGRRV
jgi:Zn-dependent M16 (insulinase) family peptidase